MTPNDRQEIYEQAKKLFQTQMYPEALALLERLDSVLTEDKKSTMLTRTRCLVHLNRLDEARRVASDLYALYGDDGGLVFLRESTGLVTGKFPKQKKQRSLLWKSVFYGTTVLAAIGIVFAIAGFWMLIRTDNAPLVGGVKAETITAKTEDESDSVKTTASDNTADTGGTNDSSEPAVSDDSTTVATAGNDDQMSTVGNTPQDAQNADQTQPLSFSAPDASADAKLAAGENTAEVIPATAKTIANNAPVADIVALQPFKTSQRIVNARGDEAVLTNLNPRVGAWYVLELQIAGSERVTRHLEVPCTGGNTARRPFLSLYRDGLIITMDGHEIKRIPLWGKTEDTNASTNELCAEPTPIDLLKQDYKFKSSYTPLYEGSGLVLVRVHKTGSATKMEVATDLLRQTSVGGWFVEQAKPYLLKEPEIGEDLRADSSAAAAKTAMPDFPDEAMVAQDERSLYCSIKNSGVETEASDGKLVYGRWYRAVKHPGVFVSMMKPSAADKSLFDTYKDRVDEIGHYDKRCKEAEALVYLAAFDLDQFTFGYAVGADHPKVEWSKRAGEVAHKEDGPDGFGTTKPLASIGATPPYLTAALAATFTGGFKREHGAFGAGPLGKVNNGSHFGFMEEGVLFSRLQPGLATAAISTKGEINLLTWPKDGWRLLPSLAHARQNCVPLIEGIDSKGISIPGPFVNKWAYGSWSGDQKGNFQTLRGGLAFQEHDGHRFLIFAYFTGATTNGMARVFQAYRCKYAMLLDMNTPNYCYCALYSHDANGSISGAEYLHKEMAVGNGNDGSLKFVQKNDTRDFFYVLRKPDAESRKLTASNR